MEIQEPQKVIDVFKKECNEHVIACICNNQIQSLNHVLKEDTNIKFIDISDKDGLRIYIRGLSYIMAKAFSEVYPKALLTVDYQLSNSMFFEIDNMKVTDEMLEAVSNRMNEIVQEDLPITKVIMTKEEADEFYEKNKFALQDINRESIYYRKNTILPMYILQEKIPAENILEKEYSQLDLIKKRFNYERINKINADELDDFINIMQDTDRIKDNLEEFLATELNELTDMEKRMSADNIIENVLVICKYKKLNNDKYIIWYKKGIFVNNRQIFEIL